MRGKIKSYPWIIGILALFLAAVSVHAEEDIEKTPASDTRIIRVAYPIQKGLSEKDEDGKYSGYTYDYLQEIAQYTGWEYEFIEIPGNINESLVATMDMLEKGEVDLVGALSKTEQTQQLFDFPEYGYGYSYTNLTTLEENSQINETNLQNVKELRIAAYKNAKVTKGKAEDFCRLNNIQYSFVDCESQEQLEAAVKNKEADVMLGNDLSPVSGFRTVAQFGGSQFHFATTKGNTDVLNALNSAILTIGQIKPYFESSLHEKYFANRSYKTYLSEDEKKYVDSADSLKIAVVTDIEPVQYIDMHGDVAGITKDIMDQIKQETGLKMKYIPAESYEAAYKMMDEGVADAVSGIPYDYRIAQEQDLVMSNRLLEAQIVMVTADGKKDGKNQNSAVISTGVDAAGSKAYHDIKTVADVGKCMDAVSSGKASAAYMNLYSAEYMSHYSKYQNLRLIPQTGKTLEYCIGIKKPVDSTLVSLINKVLVNIEAADMETIIYQNTTGNYEKVTLTSFVKQNPFTSIGIVSAVFLIFAVVGLSALRFSMKAGRRLKIQHERFLRLSELANEYIYEYDYENDVMICSKEFARLFALPDKVYEFSKELKNNLFLASINPEIDDRFEKEDSQDKIIETERYCLLPDDSRRWFRNANAAIRDEAGKKMYIIGKLTDIQQEKEARERLEMQGQTDGLTGLLNAASTKEIIKERIEKLNRTGVLLIIDIDKFKNVNDRLGHFVGDKVLSNFAKTLSGAVDEKDTVGRIGGDEFMIFMDSVHNMEEAAAFCQRACEKARCTYRNEEGSSLSVTTSIGAVLLEHRCNFDDAFKSADKLLYESKRKGRDCYTIKKCGS